MYPRILPSRYQGYLIQSNINVSSIGGGGGGIGNYIILNELFILIVLLVDSNRCRRSAFEAKLTLTSGIYSLYNFHSLQNVARFRGNKIKDVAFSKTCISGVEGCSKLR